MPFLIDLMTILDSGLLFWATLYLLCVLQMFRVLFPKLFNVILETFAQNSQEVM